MLQHDIKGFIHEVYNMKESTKPYILPLKESICKNVSQAWTSSIHTTNMLCLCYGIIDKSKASPIATCSPQDKLDMLKKKKKKQFDMFHAFYECTALGKIGKCPSECLISKVTS